MTKRATFAVFSVFDVSTRKDIERLMKPAIKGRCRIVADADDFFGGEGGKDYCSKVLTNPTYADLLKVLDEQIKATRDDHHVFMEGVVKRRRAKKYADSVPEYEFLLGS